MYKQDYFGKMLDVVKEENTYIEVKKDPTNTLQTKNSKLISKLFLKNKIDQKI